MLRLLYAERAGVDRGKPVAMAPFYDLGEARTGDVATRSESGGQRVDPDEKETAERAAVAVRNGYRGVRTGDRPALRALIVRPLVRPGSRGTPGVPRSPWSIDPDTRRPRVGEWTPTRRRT